MRHHFVANADTIDIETLRCIRVSAVYCRSVEMMFFFPLNTQLKAISRRVGVQVCVRSLGRQFNSRRGSRTVFRKHREGNSMDLGVQLDVDSVCVAMMAKSDGKERLVVKETKSVIPEDDDESPNASPVDYEYSDHQSLHEMLDPSLQPEPPIPNNRLSQELYQEHIRLAKEYLRVDTQLYYAKDDRDKYLATLDPVEREQKEAFLRKHSEKEELLELYKNLKQQLERTRGPQQNHSTADPQTSRAVKLPSQTSSDGLATEVVDDGWLVIAPKENNT